MTAMSGWDALDPLFEGRIEVLGPFTFTTGFSPLGINERIPSTNTLSWIP
jgi:hypothetical protein